MAFGKCGEHLTRGMQRRGTLLTALVTLLVSAVKNLEEQTRKKGSVLAHGLRTHNLLWQGRHGKACSHLGAPGNRDTRISGWKRGFQPINLPPVTHIHQPDPISYGLHSFSQRHHKPGAKRSHESMEGVLHLSHHTSQGQHKTQVGGSS